MEWALFWFFCALFSGIVGGAKGRSGFGWFLMGLLFGPLGVIFAAGMPSLQVTQPARTNVNSAPPKTKVCPDCAETILSDAKVCKHCGYRFPEKPPTEKYFGKGFIRCRNCGVTCPDTAERCYNCYKSL